MTPMNSVFDAHVHIIDSRFPLWVNQGFIPRNFRVRDYYRALRDLQLRSVGGAVVSASFQGVDQSYLAFALEQLGPLFVGVTQLPAQASAAEILQLHRAGVRAVRFNLYRGGSAGLEALDTLARRVYAVAGWHSELYLDSRHLPELFSRLSQLPRLCLDHLGLSQAGLPWVLKLVEQGVKVKATGFSRGDIELASALRQIYDLNPTALMFGTDLPCTRAPRTFSRLDLEILERVFNTEELGRVLRENAQNWYGRR